MTNTTSLTTLPSASGHTPGPWQQDWQFIVAPDPAGIHPDIYIAEIAEEGSEGRIASPEQQAANVRLIVAAPELLAACRMVIKRWERGDLAEAATACQDAVTLATDGNPPWDITEAARSRLRRMHAADELLAALAYLMEQTVEMDIQYGIALSEGEEDARSKALAAIRLATAA